MVSYSHCSIPLNLRSLYLRKLLLQSSHLILRPTSAICPQQAIFVVSYFTYRSSVSAVGFIDNRNLIDIQVSTFIVNSKHIPFTTKMRKAKITFCRKHVVWIRLGKREAVFHIRRGRRHYFSRKIESNNLGEHKIPVLTWVTYYDSPGKWNRE